MGSAKIKQIKGEGMDGEMLELLQHDALLVRRVFSSGDRLPWEFKDFFVFLTQMKQLLICCYKHISVIVLVFKAVIRDLKPFF